jgi:uncharacterized protein (TIGR03643 family)
MTKFNHDKLSRGEIDRIIMMAWEDRTSFDAIRTQFGLSPGDVIKLMRAEMTGKSFKMWRKRTQGRTTKQSLPKPTRVIKHVASGLGRNVADTTGG